MEEERHFNNCDLGVVKCMRSLHRLLPPRQADIPFAALLPPQTQTQKEKTMMPAPAPEPAKKPDADAGWRFPDVCTGSRQDGDELLKDLLAAHPPLPLPSPRSPPPLPPQQQQQLVVTAMDVPPPQVRTALPSTLTRVLPSVWPVLGGLPNPKRRRNQMKKVVRHVPADGSSSDVWAWRKYGQKPIKGSPYPRGYYRCGSIKGCTARKQVERSHLDPNTFILTYISEHNHAMPTHSNSLARTTRHMFPSSAAPLPPPSVVVGGADTSNMQHQQPIPSLTTMSTAGLSPMTPLCMPSMEQDDDEDKDELMVEDMEIAGEDELLFLNTDGDYIAPLEQMSSLSDMVDESFLSSPWVSASTIADQPAKGQPVSGADLLKRQ
ncbi:hypothetical protein GQ55_1G110600 [Panicum hallii var. hallii]|uniref:WRKY domain-containing protein n=1 Tax=Panicum hallii var. hallii TaxID=1504633 RepID=A0A2T7F4H6_9POAL|nr:hypothetical protein GQ55_1G110600 [Panicum hallii var. hallii]